MWPPPRSSRRWPSSCPQRGGRFILGRSSKRVVITVDTTILVLHVGILLDGLLIAQPLNMLHYQSADNHAGGLVARTVVPVLQTLVVFLLYLVPGKIVGKLHPAVGACSTPRETLEAQTARDCGIGSSISCRFLLILTPKGSHFK